MGSKPGFMMYHSRLRALAKMNPESFKAVMMALCDYSEFGAEPTALNDMEALAFGMAREALDRDTEKYQKRVEAGRKGGIASGEVRRMESKQNEAKRSKMKQTNQRNRNPTVTPTVTAGNTTYSSPQTPQESGGERLDIPTLEEVREYVRVTGLEVDPDAFVLVNEANGWLDGRGMPIRNWRLWMQGTLIGRTQRKEDRHEADDQPDMAGRRDEYGGLFV